MAAPVTSSQPKPFLTLDEVQKIEPKKNILNIHIFTGTDRYSRYPYENELTGRICYIHMRVNELRDFQAKTSAWMEKLISVYGYDYTKDADVKYLIPEALDKDEFECESKIQSVFKRTNELVGVQGQTSNTPLKKIMETVLEEEAFKIEEDDIDFFKFNLRMNTQLVALRTLFNLIVMKSAHKLIDDFSDQLYDIKGYDKDNIEPNRRILKGRFPLDEADLQLPQSSEEIFNSLLSQVMRIQKDLKDGYRLARRNSSSTKSVDYEI